LEKSRHVRTGCFLSKFHFYSDPRQTSNLPNLSHTFSYIRRPIPTIHRLMSYCPGCLCERVSHEMQIAPYLQFNFRHNIHLLAENGRLEGIRNDLDEKHLWHKIKRGTSKSPPNLFKIKKLEDDIWTFEQIDKLRQAPNMSICIAPHTSFQLLSYPPVRLTHHTSQPQLVWKNTSM
jgi:hypothetical protein